MSRSAFAAPFVIVAGVTMYFAVLGAAAPRDGEPPAPAGKSEEAGPGPGGPPGGPGGPPGGFGPGTFLAPKVFELADSDKDGRLSPEEAAAAAERFVREADAAKK